MVKQDAFETLEEIEHLCIGLAIVDENEWPSSSLSENEIEHLCIGLAIVDENEWPSSSSSENEIEHLCIGPIFVDENEWPSSSSSENEIELLCIGLAIVENENEWPSSSSSENEIEHLCIGLAIVENENESALSSENEDDSPIRSILCLKNNVSLEEFDQVEDCFMLDFNPFESDDLPGKLSIKDDDGQDLCFIAQRGKVACRDYPHSRHLCANFPFNKTPHENHCEQCYCYVCDSIAPCESWKKPGERHCDATEHGDMWKDLRKNRLAPLPNLKATVPS